MRETENITALSELRPDYMGFIFWAPSSRYVSDTTPSLPASIKNGGFCRCIFRLYSKCVEKHQLQAVQLHGKETAFYCALVQQFKVEVIKAFSIKDHFDFSLLIPYEQAVDYFLFDTKGALPGGNGYGFDWTILNNYPNQKPFFF